MARRRRWMAPKKKNWIRGHQEHNGRTFVKSPYGGPGYHKFPKAFMSSPPRRHNGGIFH